MNLTVVGWLSVPPLVAAVAGLYLFGALSDRHGKRRGWCAIALSGFGLTFGLAVLFPTMIWLSFALIMLAGLLSKAMSSPYWSMPALIFPPGVAGGARGIINGLGNLGGFIGPSLVGWLTTMTGSINAGIYSLALVLVVGSLICMLLPKAAAAHEFRN